MDLIDRKELRKEIDKHAYPYSDSTANDIYFSVLHLLADAPTVDAVEVVRHGKWEGYHGDKFCKDGEYRHYHFYVCNNCGRRTAVKTKYCPDCGCRMDGD